MVNDNDTFFKEFSNGVLAKEIRVNAYFKTSIIMVFDVLKYWQKKEYEWSLPKA